MAVRIAKIDAAAAVPVIELAILKAPRRAAIGELRRADAAEDGIELGIADVESVVVAFEVPAVIEKQRERVVDTDRREMAAVRIYLEAENSRKELCRCPLIAGRDDGVVESDGHRKASRCQLPRSAFPPDKLQVGRGRGGMKGFTALRQPSHNEIGGCALISQCAPASPTW